MPPHSTTSTTTYAPLYKWTTCATTSSTFSSGWPPTYCNTPVVLKSWVIGDADGDVEEEPVAVDFGQEWYDIISE